MRPRGRQERIKRLAARRCDDYHYAKGNDHYENLYPRIVDYNSVNPAARNDVARLPDFRFFRRGVVVSISWIFLVLSALGKAARRNTLNGP